MLIPRGGWSALSSRTAHDLDGRATAPWARPETDGVFVDTLKRHLSDGVIKEFDHHINDAAFADACVAELIGLLSAR